MKRVLSMILCVVMLFGLLAVSASAEAEPTVRVSSAQAKAGDTVTLDVAVENNPGIYALTFSFDYDTTRLELKSVTPNKAAFPGNWQTSKKGATWMSNDGDIAEDATILTMTFEVLADAEAGDAKIEIGLGEILNEDMDDIVFTSVPGTVTVTSGETPQPSGDPTVRVSSAQAKAGDTVTLDVAVENNPGIYALTFSFDYDTTRLELKSVTPNKAAFPGNWQTSKKGATWMSNDGDIGENATILTMTFEVLANTEAGDAKVEIVLGEILNEDIEDIVFTSVPGTITVESAAPAGAMIDIYGFSISANGSLGLNLYLVIPEEILSDSGAYVTIDSEKKLISEAETRTVGDQVLYRFSIEKPATRMSQKVTLLAYTGEDVQIPLRSSTTGEVLADGVNTSINDYLEAAPEQGNDALTKLAQAMSAYGKYAQAFFDEEEALPTVTGVTDEEIKAYASQVTLKDGSGLKYQGMSLIVESNSAIRNYFYVESGAIGDYSFTLDGANVTPAQSGSSWFVEVPGVPGALLDQEHKLVVTKDGEEIASITFSGLSYCANTLNYSESTEMLKDLVRTIYLYNQAANEFFGK